VADPGHSAASSVPTGHTRVYRAVSEAEYQDILASSQFRAAPNSLEGKWFADSAECAKAHGEALFPGSSYRLIQADVPDDVPSLFRHENLDGLGPARFLHIDDLKGVVPRPLDSP
jgi:hypothetical protein